MSAVVEQSPCVVCGSEPAAVLSIRRHVGMVFLQRFVKLRQPLCRDCGTREVKHYTLRTLRTLWQGWWGYISFFVNFFVLAANVVAWVGYRRLETPGPSAKVGATSRWGSAFDDAGVDASRTD